VSQREWQPEWQPGEPYETDDLEDARDVLDFEGGWLLAVGDHYVVTDCVLTIEKALSEDCQQACSELDCFDMPMVAETVAVLKRRRNSLVRRDLARLRGARMVSDITRWPVGHEFPSASFAHRLRRISYDCQPVAAALERARLFARQR
jgi:hypothetical protein